MQLRLRFFSILITLVSTSIIWISAQSNPFPIQIDSVSTTTNDGWSCGDFPCENDIEGFLQRIRVPAGFTVAHLGQFPGQPMQIVYGADGRLYATVLEKGTRRGAVYAMDGEGNSERVSPRFWSPVGIAFDEKGQLYVSSRLNPDSDGVIWRVESDMSAEIAISDLPCCYAIDNQPNGMVFGEDGFLYLAIGSTSDRGESSQPESERYATPHPQEASVLKIDIDSGDVQVYANGIRNPYDLAFTASGQLFATDNGLVTGQGDRLLQVDEGAFYGFPYWRSRGCPECPPREGREAENDWLLLQSYTLPRGIVAYDGEQFPANMVNTLFVAFWNGTDYAQRIVWITPDDSELAEEDYTPFPFMTGLIRPVDVTVASDGSLVVADFIYGHIWRVSYDTNGNEAVATLPAVIATVASANETNQPIPATPTPNASGIVFATATPSN